jgi:hypothetical protein
MADTKTSAETTSGTLRGPEQFRGVQSGSNMKVTTAQIAAFLAPPPSYVAANWYLGGLAGQQTIAGSVLSTTLQYMIPVIIRQQCTIGALGMRIATLGTSNVQMALYASDPAAVNRPGALLSNTASFVNTATGFFSSALLANQQLDPGTYWIALQVNDVTMISVALSAASGEFTRIMGSATAGNSIQVAGTQVLGLTAVSVFGTWANMTGATFTELTVQRTGAFAFQVASVP